MPVRTEVRTLPVLPMGGEVSVATQNDYRKQVLWLRTLCCMRCHTTPQELHGAWAKPDQHCLSSSPTSITSPHCIHPGLGVLQHRALTSPSAQSLALRTTNPQASYGALSLAAEPDILPGTVWVPRDPGSARHYEYSRGPTEAALAAAAHPGGAGYHTILVCM
jgi:hypothetical protein